MIYIFDELEKVDDEYLKNCEGSLSQERRDKILRLKTPGAKIQSAIAYMLLRYALHCEYNIDEAVLFEYNHKGKPALKDYPHIHISLSHCKTAAACALSESEIGVDIQDIRPVTDRLLRRVLTENEYIKCKNSASPKEYFCRAWTIKESIIKKTGQGIGETLFKINSENIKDVTIYRGNNYYCCVTEVNMKEEKISIGAL